MKRVVERLGFDGLGKRAVESPSLGQFLSVGTAVSVSGDMLVDIPNNYMFSRVSRWQMVGPAPVVNASISFPVISSLVMFDLGKKNYTWDASSCSCSTATGTSEMPLLAVPPFAVFVSNNSALNQGNGGVANGMVHFKANYTFVSFVDPLAAYTQGNASQSSDIFTTIDFFVDQANMTRRVEFTVVTSDAHNLTVMLDLWDPSEVKDNKLVLPDASCADKCPGNGLILANSSATCVQPASECKCINSTKLSFCNISSISLSSVSTTVYEDDADAVAQAANSAVLAAIAGVKDGNSLSDSCQAEIKQFLCQFYLPQCTAAARFAKPQTLVCLATLNDAQQKAVFSSVGAFSAYRTIAGDTTLYPNGFGLQGWQIAVIVLSSAALVGGVVFGLVQRSKSKRDDYQSV